MEPYSARKRNEILTPATILNSKALCQEARWERANTAGFHLRMSAVVTVTLRISIHLKVVEVI